MDFITPHFDGGRGKTLYFQLYEHIKNEILNGQLRQGDKLPSKRRLSVHLHVSQNTIQSAYDQLAAEGYISTVPKSGHYVNALEELMPLKVAAAPSGLKPDSKPYRYDFSPGGVDLESFPFRTWKRLNNEVLDENDPDLLLPGDPRGYHALRAAISSYLHQSRGVVCDAERIIVSSGTEYLLQLLIQLLGKDHVFALENPGYEKTNLIFESNGLSFVGVPVDESGMSFSALSESRADVACITPSHQFPTGVIMPIQRRMQLLNWAYGSSGRYIVEDDYDSEFKYAGRPIPAMQGIDEGEKVIYMGSFSKSLTSGLRISYMALPRHLFDRYSAKLSFYICPVSIVQQKCLHLFIERGHFERHLNKMRVIYRKKRELLADAVATNMRNVRILGANAGLHLLLQVENGMTESQLVESAAKREVGLCASSRYYLQQKPYEPSPRVLLGYAAVTERQISEAADLLKQAWF